MEKTNIKQSTPYPKKNIETVVMCHFAKILLQNNMWPKIDYIFFDFI